MRIFHVLLLAQALESHQLLWEQLEDLDHNTQLLDPPSALAKPYSHCSRCIALGGGASCQVQLSATAPCALPSSVVFHGPSSTVAGLQTSWYSRAHKLWQEQLSVRENLQAILQVITSCFHTQLHIVPALQALLEFVVAATGNQQRGYKPAMVLYDLYEPHGTPHQSTCTDKPSTSCDNSTDVQLFVKRGRYVQWLCPMSLLLALQTGDVCCNIQLLILASCR